jgi:hypothetical protein
MSYYKENAWWVSLYNDKPEVVAQSAPKHPVEIHDATLRDGEQPPGVVFSKDDKLRLPEKLIECGVTLMRRDARRFRKRFSSYQRDTITISPRQRHTRLPVLRAPISTWRANAGRPVWSSRFR